MATILDKDITRVSTIEVDEREVLVTLTADQTISLKLKGLKKGEVSISIQDLYNQLSGSKQTAGPSESKKTGKQSISLHDLKSRIMVDGQLDYNAKTIFDKILREVING